MASFHASMAKKPRQKKGQKPRPESMCPESPEAGAAGASSSSAPAVNVGASSSSAPAVNVGASSSGAPALNVGADCWWEKDMAHGRWNHGSFSSARRRFVQGLDCLTSRMAYLAKQYRPESLSLPLVTTKKGCQSTQLFPAFFPTAGVFGSPCFCAHVLHALHCRYQHCSMKFCFRKKPSPFPYVLSPDKTFTGMLKIVF